jgi:uncharacterized protein (TIGR03435 family)
MKSVIVILCLLLLSASAILGQSPTEPRFEVASVKRNVSGESDRMSLFLPGGRFVATNTPPLSLILNGYGIQRFQLVGAPDWLETERYDINAVAEGGSGPPPTVVLADGHREMLRALLADRFKLVTHQETRMLPGHALVRERPDGKLGPQLKPVSVDCEALRTSGKLVTQPRRTMQDVLAPRVCSVSEGPGTFVAGNTSLDNLARGLTRSVNAPVRNETGLDGEYEIVLRWNPDPLAPSSGRGSADPTLPSSLSIALREQLGLKLESRLQPVEVVVIDKIDRPAEN